MTELLTSAQMRAIEGAAIDSGRVTGLELMERAGRAVVEAILAEWPGLAEGERRGGVAPAAVPASPPEYLGQEEGGGAPRALVLCGPGNNGGDGFVVARLLHGRGWDVQVFLHGAPERLPPAARVNYERWCGRGPVRDLAVFRDAGREEWRAAILVDALFGTGLTRPVEGVGHLFRDIADRVDGGIGTPDARGLETAPLIVSVDIPSGICADSGRVLAPEAAGDALSRSTGTWSVVAHLTVSFHRAKLGHVLDQGALRCGKLVVADIGLPQASGGEVVRATSGPPGLGKYASRAHKFDYGHALVLSGPAGHGGAARLAARGALRIGAGLVTVGCPAEAIAENAAHLNAIMLRAVDGGESLHDLLSDRRINALCIGPGLGATQAQAGLIAAALERPVPGGAEPPPVDATAAGIAAGNDGQGHRPAVVLDADALTLLSRDATLFARLHDRCILTPHAGEFARLFPDIAERLARPATRGPAYSKLDATREAAARAGCTVLYKGADTVIADPSGRAAVNASAYERAAPWLATAGSGDVLAGIITGLLARGRPPFDAACAGAWLHTECALSYGPGLIAEDLPEALPKVFRSLGL